MGREGSDKHYGTPLEAFIDVYGFKREAIVAHSTEREDEHNDVLYLALKTGERVEAHVAFVERDAEGTMIKWCHEADGPRATRPSIAVMRALDPLLPADRYGFAAEWRGAAWSYVDACAAREGAERRRMRNERAAQRRRTGRGTP